MYVLNIYSLFLHLNRVNYACLYYTHNMYIYIAVQSRYYISFWLVIFNQLMMSTRIYNVTHVQSYILNSCSKRIAHSNILQSLVIIISPLITKSKYIIFLNKNVKNLR